MLMPAKERVTHIEFCCDTSFHVREDGEVFRQEKLSSNIGLLVTNAFSDAVIFTGNVKIRNLQLEPDIFHERTGKMSFDASGLKGETIPANKKARLIFTNWFEVSGLRVRPDRLQCFKACPATAGSIDGDVEVSSRNGLSWVPFTVPFCLQRTFQWYGGC